MKALNIVTVVSFLFFASIAVASEVPADKTVAKDSTAVTTNQSNDELFDKMEDGLVYSLNSSVRGVVESALYNAVSFKIAHPDFSSESVERILNRIAVEGEDHSLRYRAYLTLAYYKQPNQFGSPKALLTLLDHKQKEGIFFYLQEIVRTDQFTSNLN